MNPDIQTVLSLLQQERPALLKSWLHEVSLASASGSVASEVEASELLASLQQSLEAGGDPEQFQSAAWAPLRETLSALSRTRAAQGQSAGDTSAFLLALKRPLFASLQQRPGTNPQQLVSVTWTVSSLVDKMAQWTVNTFQQSREDIIKRQQEELLELSTPVIKLWEGVLAVPMIGTLDSARTQVVMESLLERIVETGSQLAIIDITGVPTVDTLVAQHLLKTVSAIRLMGADCIISGIRPQIAQTIVHLGIDLQGVASKATLADALALALDRSGFRITRHTAAA